MTALKQRTRLYYAGQATYRLVQPDRGYGGPYGQDRLWAKWACIDCHAIVLGEDDRPHVGVRWTSPDGREEWDTSCANNGHAPCWACGKQLPRLNDGCPREHRWINCPGKTEAHRMQPQHAHAGHLERPETRSQNGNEDL